MRQGLAVDRSGRFSRAWLRRSFAFLVAVVFVVAPAAALAAPAGKAPVIVSLHAVPRSGGSCWAIDDIVTCPAGGGPVWLSAQVRNASVCTFSHSADAASDLRFRKSVGCASGRTRIALPRIVNNSQGKIRVSFLLTARSGSGATVKRRVSVLEMGADPPPQEPDPTPEPQPAPPPAPPPAPAPPPPPAPAPTPPPPTLRVETSDNWSGYLIGGGPFDSVRGTFNIPNLYAAPLQAEVAEWVGIDGVDNGSLIQAGVDETYDPQTNKVIVQPWWEILPAPPFTIPMRVAPGDQVTVTIWQLSGQDWVIQLVDDTSGQRFQIERTYTGPATSAEWIVEAATSTASGQVMTLGHYTPNVTFTNDGFHGGNGETSVTQETLVQGGIAVSTPSPLNASGNFSVAYGAAAPPAP